MRRRSLRAWLVLGNLAFAATSAVASASPGVLYAAAGCCGGMAALVNRPSHGVHPPTPRVGLPLAETSLDRCLVNEISRECDWLGQDLEREGHKKRALIYYRKACVMGSSKAPCMDAARLAADFGCLDAFDCGDIDLHDESTPAGPQWVQLP